MLWSTKADIVLVEESPRAGFDAAACHSVCWHVAPCLALRLAPACCAVMRNLRQLPLQPLRPGLLKKLPVHLRPSAGQQEKPPTGNTADETQKQQVASECADLLKMATDLKSEVGKTTRDTLSVTVVRKASEIEQLAHKVRTGSPKG